MNYFKLLGIVFGLLALLKPIYMHVLPFDEMKFIKKTYGKKRPWWILVVGFIGLFLLALTWYKHFTLSIDYSIILTILFSLTAIKAIIFLFKYDDFQKWVEKMINKEKGRKIVIIDLIVGIFGLGIIIMTFIFY